MNYYFENEIIAYFKRAGRKTEEQPKKGKPLPSKYEGDQQAYVDREDELKESANTRRNINTARGVLGETRGWISLFR